MVGPQSASGCWYEGTLDGSKVKVRRIKFHPGDSSQMVKEVRPRCHDFSVLRHGRNPQASHQAVAVCKHLAHRNVTSILGVTTDPLQLISVWMSDEDLTGYIKNHPEADRQSLVGISFAALFSELIPSPAIRCRRRSQLPPLLRRDPWESRGSTPLSWILSYHYVDPPTANYSRRQRQPCADHRHWSCYGHAKHGPGT